MKEEELKKLLQDLQNSLVELNNKIDEKPEKEIHLHIENVMIDTLQLDELAYHLDQIDIKELSGMLNLGNSFSPTVQSKKQTSSSKTDPKSNPKDSSTETDESGSNREEENMNKQGFQASFVKILINGREVNSNFSSRKEKL